MVLGQGSALAGPVWDRCVVVFRENRREIRVTQHASLRKGATSSHGPQPPRGAQGSCGPSTALVINSPPFVVSHSLSSV